jgi:predicted TIM-barrel fold metal-dependent hydrolase
MPSQPNRIDVHHHILPPDFMAWLAENHSDWTGGPDVPQWTPEKGIRIMDSNGIAAAIASVVPGIYWGDTTAASKWATHCNEYAADVRRDYPKRFGAMATLPLPDTAAACKEAEHALDTLGLDAVILFASHGNQYLGDPAYDELMHELDKREAIVLIHPNTAPPGSDVPKLHLPYAIVEFMMDTSRAVTNLLFSGVFERFPRIRWIVAHAGAMIPYIGWRVRLGEINPKLRAAVPKGTIHYLRQLYYDTALSASEPTLAALREFAQPDHLLFGSDYPFVSETLIKEEVAGIENSKVLDDRLRRAIDRDNALKLFPRFAEPEIILSESPPVQGALS